MIRARIDQLLSPSLGALASLASFLSRCRRAAAAEGKRAPAVLERFLRRRAGPRHGNRPCSEKRTRRLPNSCCGERRPSGHVALVGAGPGAEDLLTLRAQRLLMEADVIVHDALVPEAVVAMGRRDAERLPVGKRKGCHSKSQAEINALLVALGREGKRVVRLKSGDPLVFGRAGEEMQALRDAGISYEVVPGVTAAFAAAADFELPLTLRGVASSMVFTTGHDLKGGTLPDWARLAISGATVAVYMGRSVAADVAARLIEAGLSPDTAVAVVENASLGGRRLFHGTLADLPSLEARDDLTGPVMTIIGDAVAGANFSNVRAAGGAVAPGRRARWSAREHLHEGPHRQSPDRRRGRLVRARIVAGPRRSPAPRWRATRLRRNGSRRSARPPIVEQRGGRRQPDRRGTGRRRDRADAACASASAPPAPPTATISASRRRPAICRPPA